ncbi:MAG: AAA family ATPase [Acidimicrobiales bacterium]
MNLNCETIRSLPATLSSPTNCSTNSDRHLSDGAIFLYGPPGTGKTSLAERMIKIHKDSVVVPAVPWLLMVKS